MNELPAPSKGKRARFWSGSLGSWSLWFWKRPQVVVMVVVGAYYLASMSRDLSFFDSAELAMVAATLGVGHPTGQPLHTVLSWLSGLVFPKPWAFNAVSAIAGAMALGFGALVLIAAERSGPGEHRSSQLNFQLNLTIRCLCLGAVAMALPLWEPSTRVEVYSLGAFCSLASLVFTLRATVAPHGVLHLVLAGYTACLAVSTNPVIGVCTFLSVGTLLLPHFYLLWRTKTSSVKRSVFVLLGGSIVGLAPFLYLPFSAASETGFIWGGLTSADEWRDFFSAHDYRHNQGATVSVMFDHAITFYQTNRYGQLSFLVVGVLAVLVSLVTKQARLLSLAAAANWLLGIAAICGNVVFRFDNPDYLGYLMAPNILFVVLALLQVRALVDKYGRQRSAKEQSALIGAVSAMVVVIVVLGAVPSPLTRTRHEDSAARQLSSATLRSLPRNAILIAQSDHFVAPMLYLQNVEHLRPDVVVVALGLSSSSWYWRYLYQQHPDLQQVPLAGPHGRLGRIGRLISANRDRPLHSETRQLLTDLAPHYLGAERPPLCSDGWSSHRGVCRESLWPERLVARLVDEVGTGSPMTQEALAQVAHDLAVDRIRGGGTNAGYRLLIASLPQHVRAQLPSSIGGLPRMALAEVPRETILETPLRNREVALQLLHMTHTHVGADVPSLHRQIENP